MKKDFAQKVYDVVAAIPMGKVMSYGEVAWRAGSPRAARAVGSLMNKNQDFQNIPCHRVILGNGHVGQYNGGEQQKITKLEAEACALSTAKRMHSK